MRPFGYVLLTVTVLLGCSELAQGSGEKRTLEASTYLHMPLPAEVLERLEVRYGRSARERFEHLERMVVEHQNSSDRVKLEAVNRFFSRVKYQPDYEGWGEDDYWALPLETLGRNSGDCEDMAIAKYVTLTIMGADPDRLYLVFGMYKKKQKHAVLAYLPPDAEYQEAWVLDNIKKRIVSLADRKDLTMYLAINDAGVLYRRDPESYIQRMDTEKVPTWGELIDRREQLDPDFYEIFGGPPRSLSD